MSFVLGWNGYPMAQKETEQLNEIMHGAALSRAVSTVADLGVADHILMGEPRSAGYLAEATGANERSLYRLLRFLANHGIDSFGSDRIACHYHW